MKSRCKYRNTGESHRNGPEYTHAPMCMMCVLVLYGYILFLTQWSVVISGDGWFYDFGDSNRAFKRDCTVYTGY